MSTTGIVPPTPYKIVDTALVVTDNVLDAIPMISNVTGELTPTPALYQTDWGPYGPNQAIDADNARTELIRKCWQGKAFSGVTRRLGRVKF